MRPFRSTTARRVALSAATGVVLLGLVATAGWMMQSSSLRHAVLSVHDGVWLPAVGLLVYGGYPWSVIVLVSLVLLLLAWWAIWVLDVPVMSLPTVLAAWVVLRHLQPDGRSLVALRRLEIRGREFLRRRRQASAHRSAVVEVAEALAERDMIRAWARQAESRSGSPQAFGSSIAAPAASRRLMFIADYLVPCPGALGAVATDVPRIRAEAIARSGLYAGADAPDLYARFQEAAFSLLGESGPAGSSVTALARSLVRATDSRPARPELSVAILTLIHSNDSVQAEEDFRLAEGVIQRRLAALHAILNALEAWDAGALLRHPPEELRLRFAAQATEDAAHWDMSEVVEAWLARLLDKGEVTKAAHWGAVTLALTEPDIRRPIDLARRLPWQEEERVRIGRILSASRCRFRASLLHMTSLAWFRVIPRLSDARLAAVARDRAWRGFFEGGELEWVRVAEETQAR